MTWLDIAGQKAIVTGAASGIGLAVARALSKEGTEVIACDRKVVTSKERSHKWHYYQCDVQDPNEIQEVISKADMNGSLTNILVNCAGITKDATLQNLDTSSFQDVIGVNLVGTFNFCKHFLNSERIESLNGAPISIINISSIVGDRGNFGQTNYAASKAGVIGFTKSLAKEGGRYNCRANAILPGFIDTPMLDTLPDFHKEHVLQNIALSRFGKPEEVADLVAYLASHRSSYISGSAIECTGCMIL